MATKTKIYYIYGQAGATWIIESTSKEEAEHTCNKLAEAFKPEPTPDDEFREFKEVDKNIYSCTYEFRYAPRKRRQIRVRET
jgi:hypothetical protein